MNCLECIDGHYFIYGENKCYNFSLLQENKYYFNTHDSIFHKCYYSCEKCSNIEPNEENHNCIECVDNYFKLEDSFHPNNCYNQESNVELTGLKLSNIINEINKSSTISLSETSIALD